MRKRILFLAAASLAWASTALAADPPIPVITETPMPGDTSGLGTQAQASDLPAPDTRSWVNRPLLVTSSILLVGSYVPMAAIAFTSDRPADQTNLYYPVVGPWLNLGDRQCDIRACNNEGLKRRCSSSTESGRGSAPSAS